MGGVGRLFPARRALALTAAAAVAACLAAAACGRSGYQYLENGDDTVFVKIPENWEVVSEGVVDYTVTPDGDLQLLPGDSALPWRATFTETTAAPGSSDQVTGAVEIQPVDRRMRADLNPYRFFGIDPNDTADGIEVVRHDLVKQGDLSGPRLVWRQTNEQGQEMIVDRMVMTDSLNRVIYSVGFGCNESCYGANESSIEEIMATFTVTD